MPRISRRKRKYNLFKRLFISSIYNRIAHEILFDDSSIGSQEEANINFFALNLLQTINNRYIDRAPTYAPRSYAVLNATTDYSDPNFLLHFRMEKAAFYNLAEEIRYYHEFQPRVDRFGRQYPRKASVEQQLLVFLYSLGADGSDSNYKKIGTRFQISNGIVQIFIDRCTRAIKSMFEHEVISWPDTNERKVISQRFQAKYGFANCVGIVDGTVFPLAFKPSEYGEEYWYRKGGYCLHSIIICDDEMRVLDFLAGYPGSVHDNRVWCNTDQFLHYNNYFSRFQYLLADSAFATGVHLIAAFKRLRGLRVLPEDQELFNTYLAKARIKVEHCIGLLKNRFRSLRGLRTIISDEASAKRVIDRITLCIILHNLLLDTSYPNEWIVDGLEEE